MGVKWRLFELLNQNGHTTQALAYDDMCTTQLYQSANTDRAIQHMLSAVITTHALTTHQNCFYGGADLSSANIQLGLHSQVTDYTMESRLPCGS